MRSGDFELRVVGSQAAAGESVYLDEEQAFTLEVVSRSAAHHEMALKIGGVDMGLFDLPAGRTIHLLEGERGPFRFYDDSPPPDLTGSTPATGWIMALFLPLQAERHFTVLPSPVLGPKLADHADLAGYNLDELTSIEVQLQDINMPLPVVELGGEPPDPSVLIIPAANVPSDEPSVSAEKMLRYRRQMKRDLYDFLRLCSGMSLDELELAHAKVSDLFNKALLSEDVNIARLRLVALDRYFLMRTAGQRRRRFWLRIETWVTHPMFQGTLGDLLTRKVLKLPLTLHPVDPASLPSDEDLRQMVDALAP